MNVNHRKAKESFKPGYNAISTMNELRPDMLMDFGILVLSTGEVFEDKKPLERAYLLVQGEVQLEWAGQKRNISRVNCFDECPWVLHVPSGVEVKITGVAPESELTVHRTDNSVSFDCKLFEPQDTKDEYRGTGTMNETSTRIVRTVFDKSNAPWSNLILGEVINFPGKWSSYPPHDHPQPEIYYYRINPSNGYGYAELGEEVVKVRNNDVVFIEPGVTHPQVATPGYALWYMWVIRHLEDNVYITPRFLPEHLWAMEKDAVIWPNKA